MRVIIVGAGEVGYPLAERLSQENQDVVVVDANPERANRASELLDVMTVVENGASIPILEEAGIRGARVLLTVTSQDEVNVGPTDNYGWMSDSALAVMSFLMLAGRLEIYTVILLFHPDTWKFRGSGRRTCSA